MMIPFDYLQLYKGGFFHIHRQVESQGNIDGLFGSVNVTLSRSRSYRNGVYVGSPVHLMAGLAAQSRYSSSRAVGGPLLVHLASALKSARHSGHYGHTIGVEVSGHNVASEYQGFRT